MSHPVVRIVLFCVCLLTPLSARGADPLTLNGQLTVDGAPWTTDVWGWTDPLTSTPYALMGNNNSGLHIIDVSDPGDPTLTAVVTGIPSFDVKTWKHYAYTVDGNYGLAGGPGGIVDISDPANPAIVGSIPAAHNVFIEERGFMYACHPGLRIYVVGFTETNPYFLWEDLSTEGHDATVVGTTLYFSSASDGTFIYDVVNPSAPVLLGSITDPSIIYHHNSWPTADGNYLLITDELATGSHPDISIWDISDLSAPFKVSSWYDPTATVHNGYVVGDYYYTSYYSAGLRVFDISNPAFPFLAAEYDPNSYVDEKLKGTFGCYPFAESGHIYISDRPAGFFVFSFNPTAVGIPSIAVPSFELRAPYPNPSAAPTIGFELKESGHVRLEVFDVRGRRIDTLVDGVQASGHSDITWAGVDQAGRPTPSGIYFVKMTNRGATLTQKLVLVR